MTVRLTEIWFSDGLIYNFLLGQICGTVQTDVIGRAARRKRFFQMASIYPL